MLLPSLLSSRGIQEDKEGTSKETTVVENKEKKRHLSIARKGALSEVVPPYSERSCADI